MLKKVLIKPPTTENQMRELCTDIINREYGSESRSTAVVSTAIQLWDDPALKGALIKNSAFLSARERIQNLSGHILPSSSPSDSCASAENLRDLDEKEGEIEEEIKRKDFVYKNYYDSAHNIVDCTLHAAMQCPSCGRNVHCLHDDPLLPEPQINEEFYDDSEFECLETYKSESSSKNDEESVKNDEEKEEETSDSSDVAVAPRRKSSLFSSTSSGCDNSENIDEHDMRINFKMWFGPLVLASLAVVGLAVGVFNGEILLPRIKTLSGRSIAAVAMLMRASKSVFYVLDR
eukprot:TRINITY_DN5719_c0_g1_i2.p1 TRINITY_DN5719_c0_g1~~TRINITY_DN5719_c0_g1_i2.p1  ORF type:complete len:290 (-),score=102.23 TRINITY_DN5719_c0_g1_i2:98-967(-)